MKSTKEFYRKYIDCLNSGDLDRLRDFLHDSISYNDEVQSLEDYRKARYEERYAIPDLLYQIELLVADQETIAARLHFDCTPVYEFMGIQPNGSKAIFAENVFYRLIDGKISSVLSLVDKDAIRRQIS